MVADPRFWGPSTWRLLHAVSFTYPSRPSAEDKKHYADCYDSLVHVLPCPACRLHYKQFLAANPVDTQSGESLQRWVWKAHDNVNKFYGKKSPSFESVAKAYLSAGDPKLATASPDEQAYYLHNEHMERMLGPTHLSKRENATASSGNSNTAVDVVIIVLAVILLALGIYRLYQDQS